MTTKKSPVTTLAVMKELFPNSIGANLPLKIGVDRDIAQRCAALTSDEISAALHLQCNAPTYLRALLTSMARRVDLDGEPGSGVTENDRFVAAASLIDHASVETVEAVRLLRKDIRAMLKVARTIEAALKSAESARET
jgi:sRNA-binding protein